MKFLATFFVCCVIIAAAKATIAVLAITLLIILISGAIFRPAQTYGFIAICLTISLFNRYPGWCLLTIATIVVVSVFRVLPTQTADPS
jgi:hypothetical protein